MSEDHHLQVLDALLYDNIDPVLYAVSVACESRALNEHGENGHFAYLDLLDGVPNTDYQNIDVEADFCLESQYDTEGSLSSGDPGSYDTGGMSAGGGADSTDGGSATDGDGAETGLPPVPPLPPAVPGVPPSCDLAERTGVIHGANNKAVWRKDSPAAIWDRNASYPAGELTGGVAYTLLPCGELGTATCIRLDELSIVTQDAGSDIIVRVGLRHEVSPVELSDAGSFEFGAGKIEFLVHHSWLGQEPVLSAASNPENIVGHIDLVQRTFTLDYLGSAPEAEFGANFALTGDIVNTQPISAIHRTWNPTTGHIILSATSGDAENDVLSHQWVVPGVGEWIGTTAEVPAPLTPVPALLFVRDSHGARFSTAIWLNGGGL
ncbi:MAG: hypothetical protein IPK74_01470 [Deltaproteobacteria bacterium]|nr:hypothetical protein [Deltaproteobacteria bacterium]